MSLHLDADPDTRTYRLTLQPNRSMTWQGTRRVMILICATSLVVGITFYATGAVMVLPFAGLEALVVCACLYVVCRRTYASEVITLTPETIRVEKHDLTWERVRFFTSVEVEHSPGRGGETRLSLRHQRDRIAIGSFLAEDDLRRLIRYLSRIIHDLT